MTVTHQALPVIQADPQQITQLIRILVSNAIRYRGPEAPLAHVSAAREGSDWVVSISDNGIGFDPAHAQNLFRAFERIHGRGVSGAGLGLASARKIVESYGGRIWADSQPGRGSRFSFTIPAAVAAHKVR